MKKLVLIMFMILLVGTVSAFEFDNVKNYDEETKTVDIRNSVLGIPFLQLGRVAEIKLNTPLNYLVPRGYQKVAEFQITSFSDYNNAFKELELFDKKKEDKKFMRNYDFKVLSYEKEYVDDYRTECINNQSCSEVFVKTREIQKEVWTNLNLSDFKKDDVITIGIFTEVLPGDNVEWIPNFFGVRINEWATWTESLNTDIAIYLKLDESSGAVVDSVGNLNGTNVGATRGITGLIGDAFSFDGTNDRVTLAGPTTNDNTFSINFWVNGTSALDNKDYFDGNVEIGTSAGNVIFFTSEVRIFGTTASVTDGDWHMLTAIANGTDLDLYVDGVSTLNSTLTAANLDTDNTIGSNDAESGAFINSDVDEFGIWNRSLTGAEVIQLYNNGAGITFTEVFGANITLISPIDNFNSTNETIIFNVTVISNDVIENVTLFIDGVLNETNTSQVNGTYIFTKNLSLGNHNWSINAVDDLNQSLNSSTRDLTIGSTIIGFTFNATTFETRTETYVVNITSFNSETPTNANLVWNAEETSATITNIGGDNFSISATRDVGIVGTSNITFNFTWNIDNQNETTVSNIQLVNSLTLDLCNSTLNTTFINFTFKNETLAEEDVNATFDSNWNYFIGSGDVSRTLSFLNATENPSYAFCLNAVNDTLFTQVNVSYTNSISQQRQFRPTLLTLSNVTTNQVLFLLPTVDGLFNTFRTEDTLGNTIIGARGTITRTLGGSPITVAIDVTDGSGLVVFFLDPDITYTATFSATGFANNVFTFVPTTDLRTVIMGSVVAAVGGSNISLGLNYTIEPTNTTLNNGTDITFQFNVSGTETITFMGFNISNGTATLLLVNQTNDGSISGVLNTGNNSVLTGVFTISTLNETIIITRTWKIEQGFIGDYSIFRQLTLFIDYGFKDFIRLLMVIATLAIVMIFMSREIGIDEEVKMAVGVLIVWAFSIVGWLDTGVAISGSSTNINNLSQFSNQYGIAIVSTVGAAYFILRRAFRQI